MYPENLFTPAPSRGSLPLSQEQFFSMKYHVRTVVTIKSKAQVIFSSKGYIFSAEFAMQNQTSTCIRTLSGLQPWVRENTLWDTGNILWGT
jgi:hypothetical protein